MVGQVSGGQVSVDGQPSSQACCQPSWKVIHREATDPASHKDLEPCVNTCPELSPLSSRTQEVLEAHIRKLQVRHRWALPLRILKPIKAFNLTRAQHSTLVQSLGTCSAICDSRALLNADFAKFLEKPFHSLPREKVRAEALFPTLGRFPPCPFTCMGGNPECPGKHPNCSLSWALSGPSDLTGGQAAFSIPHTSEGRKSHRETATDAKEGSQEPSPSLAVARSEPTEESAGWTSENFLQGMTILEPNTVSIFNGSRGQRGQGGPCLGSHLGALCSGQFLSH